MPKPHPAYPPEFRSKIVDLVCVGRKPGELAQEFNVCEQTVRNWVKQDDFDSGHRKDGLTSTEREELTRLRGENKRLQPEQENLVTSRGLVRSGDRRDSTHVFEFVKAHRAVYPIAAMCRVLGVTTSGYDAWLQRQPSGRSVADAALGERIVQLHRASRDTYGAVRLRDEGVCVGRKRVARLMRSHRLRGVCRRQFIRTTRRERDGRLAPDLVERNFTAMTPHQLWVADITYVPTWAGFLVVAVVLDAWSWRIVGRAIGAKPTDTAGAQRA
jgi:transposase-like protein